MEFKKYQHVERFGTSAVLNIELGNCFVFPKIDGTNASVWLNKDGEICAGSRNRQLSLKKDNAGFYAWVLKQQNLLDYLKAHPTHRLFGEWLVPHSLKTYREKAWRKFYVFDVCEDIISYPENGLKYLPYYQYQLGLEEFNIDFITPINVINNATYEQFIRQLDKNVFLIEDGKGVGEGIVIKNYNYKNQWGKQIWAKIVTSEFKEKHNKEMGVSQIEGKKLIEKTIAEKYVTKALCEKVVAKIKNNTECFEERQIPQLLNIVFYDIINEESWNIVKCFKRPTINFKTLYHFVIEEVKKKLPELF